MSDLSNHKRKHHQIVNDENSDEKEYYELEDEEMLHVARKKTVVEKEYQKHHQQAHEIVTHLPAETAEEELPTVEAYIPQTLADAIFCGHLVTDLDSIAGAIGAAELYGGIPARASEVNSETAFALKYWGVEKPKPIEELLVTFPDAGVCLVDHQQTSQLNKAIDVSPPHHRNMCLCTFLSIHPFSYFIGLSYRRCYRSSCSSKCYYRH
jgi:hypothetical protein